MWSYVLLLGEIQKSQQEAVLYKLVSAYQIKKGNCDFVKMQLEFTSVRIIFYSCCCFLSVQFSFYSLLSALFCSFLCQFSCLLMWYWLFSLLFSVINIKSISVISCILSIPQPKRQHLTI